LYEGSTLERVLERVQEDHGDAARIVAADRARRGGVAGFFSKEVFQVTVEVVADLRDDTSAPSDRSGAVPLGRIEPVRRLVGAGAVREIVPESDVRAPVRGVAERDAWNLFGRLGGETTAFDALAGAADTVPLDGPTFARSLADAMAAPAPLAATVPDRPRVVSGLHRHDPPLAGGSSSSEATSASAWGTLRMSSLRDAVESSASTAAGSIPSDFDASVVSLQSHRVRRTAASPAQLGALLTEFDRNWREPAPLPSTGVVAVVGSVDEVRRAAVAVALGAGVAVSSIIVASPTDPSDPPTAAQVAAMRVELARETTATSPVIVVVEVHPGRPGHDWARVVLAGLMPDHVRYVASAARRADTASLAITALGGVGAFDVLDLLDAELGIEPEEFLGVGVPVATIDGRAASAMLWAATVLAGRSNAVPLDAAAGIIDQAQMGGR